MNTTAKNTEKQAVNNKVNKGTTLASVKTSPTEVAKNEATPTARELYRIKMQETKQAFELVQNEVRASLGTKEITLKNGTVKTVEPSRTLVRAKANIVHLESLDVRTLAETKRLVASLSKVDKMSASRVYEYIFNVLNGRAGGANATKLQQYACELLGTNDVEKFPKFKDFTAELPIKFAYSENDGWNVLSKFNKRAQQLARAEKQNKATAKK